MARMTRKSRRGAISLAAQQRRQWSTVLHCLLCCATRARKLEPRQLLKFWTPNSYRKNTPAWNHHPTAFSFAFVEEMVLTWCEVDSGSPLWQTLFLQDFSLLSFRLLGHWPILMPAATSIRSMVTQLVVLPLVQTICRGRLRLVAIPARKVAQCWPGVGIALKRPRQWRSATNGGGVLDTSHHRPSGPRWAAHGADAGPQLNRRDNFSTTETRMLQDVPDSDPSYEAVSRAMREKNARSQSMALLNGGTPWWHKSRSDLSVAIHFLVIEGLHFTNVWGRKPQNWYWNKSFIWIEPTWASKKLD